jgi:hypothetical protein
MTPSEYELVKRKLPVGPAFARLNNPRPANPVQDSKPKSPVLDAAPRPDARKEGGATRVKVRIISYRRRLLDIDNLAGGAKFIIDALRYDGLIRDDSPDAIELSVSQVKVGSRDTEDTAVIIERIPDIEPETAARIYSKTLNELKL